MISINFFKSREYLKIDSEMNKNDHMTKYPVMRINVGSSRTSGINVVVSAVPIMAISII